MEQETRASAAVILEGEVQPDRALMSSEMGDTVMIISSVHLRPTETRDRPRVLVFLLMLGIVSLALFAKSGQYSPRKSQAWLFSKAAKMEEARKAAPDAPQAHDANDWVASGLAALWVASPRVDFEIGFSLLRSENFLSADFNRAPPVLLL